MRRSQVSVEYILIVGIALIILLTFFYYAINRSNVTVRLNQASDAVTTLAKTADTVYSLGPGSKDYAYITLPYGIESILINGSRILLKLRVFSSVSDIYSDSKAVVVGSIAAVQGTYKIPVEMLDSGVVEIGSYSDVTPPQIIWVDPSGTINYNDVTLKANTNENAKCKFDSNDINYSLMGYDFSGEALTHSYHLGILAEGYHSYYARCADTIGNTMNSSAAINFTIEIINITNETAEQNDPLVGLINPNDNTIDNDGAVLFQYNVTDESSISFCELIINKSIDQIASNVMKGKTQNFTKSGMDYGNYSWNVNCTDVFGNEGESIKWKLFINYTQDHDLPTVKLVAPANNTIRNYWLIKFSYNVSDATSAISFCELSLFGVLDFNSSLGFSVRDAPVSENTIESITLPLMKGNYTWNVSCTDNSYLANVGYSESRRLRINITAGEEAFLDSCAGICGYNGFSNGACENTPSKCSNYCSNCYYPSGDQYCIGGPETDTCCCIP